MEYFGLVLAGLYIAGVLIRWLFPATARILGWIVLISSVLLAVGLLIWGVASVIGGDAGIGIVAIFFACVVGAGGVFFGAALVWGKDA